MPKITITEDDGTSITYEAKELLAFIRTENALEPITQCGDMVMSVAMAHIQAVVEIGEEEAKKQLIASFPHIVKTDELLKKHPGDEAFILLSLLAMTKGLQDPGDELSNKRNERKRNRI